MSEEKKSCCCCNILSNVPCSVKLAYILIVVSLILSFFCLIKINSISNTSVSNEKIAKWIKDNPKAIIDSVQAWSEEQQKAQYEEQQKQATQNIKLYKNELNDESTAGVINPKGSITLVEFFDYNCGYCKYARKNVDELLSKRKDVKVILRAIAILGEGSTYATKIGYTILKMQPKKYLDYYNAIMETSARSKEDVAKALKSIDLSLSKVESYYSKHSSEIDTIINSNMDLAGKIGINGTPGFVINEELIPGAVPTETLNEKLK